MTIPVVLPPLEGLNERQTALILHMVDSMKLCEGEIPFSYWCPHCLASYARILELVAGWRNSNMKSVTHTQPPQYVMDNNIQFEFGE